LSGNKEGGEAMRRTMIEKLGGEEEWRAWMRANGHKGGANSTTGGFYYSKAHGLDIHIEAGRKGGKISKRGPKNETHV